MASKISKKGWRKRAITRSSGKKCELESLDGYYVIPKKLSLDIMQQITDGQGIDIDPEKFKDKTEEEIKKIIELQQKKKNGGAFSLGDSDFQNMLKLTFLYGVHDHNLNVIVDKEGKEIQQEVLDELTEEEFNKKLSTGEFINGKVVWDEALYERMREHTDTLFEIFKIVMEFNRPLQKKTS